MYRTGDVARWLDNGAVEYLGRSDDQLKIRGQRIELGEIDRVMQALPDVEQAVTHACVINQAAATGGDARQLVGYLVSQSGLPLDTSALQAQLRETYGIPVVRGPVFGLPLVEEKCLAWMECRLLPATSAQEEYDTLFGEVVSAAADARVFVEGRWQFDDDKLNTLHHLGAGTFVTSGKRVTAG